MPLPAPSESPSCAICSRPLADGPTIPTTTGSTVHIRCAEQQARAAARRRTLHAGITAALLLAVGSWALRAEVGVMRAVVLTVLLIAAHVIINRRWWGYAVQSARRWLRARG